MDKEEIIIKIRKYKDLLLPYFDIEKVIIFGSYAKGTPGEDSDIDVAIVVKNLKGDYFTNIPRLWRIRRQVDDRIEPVLFRKGEDKSGFLEEISASGIEI